MPEKFLAAQNRLVKLLFLQYFGWQTWYLGNYATKFAGLAMLN